MAVILSSNFYAITNHSHLHNHIRTSFQVACRNPTLSSPLLLHHHQRHGRLSACQASSNPNNYEAEEQRWLREEQRWLREEQRWLREEARWSIERQSLLLQIQHLQSELDNLRKIRPNSADFEVTTLTKMAALLKAKNFNPIIEFSDTKSNSELETSVLESPSDIASVSSTESENSVKKESLEKENSSSSSGSSWSTSLRVGSEGEEVRALQEALLNLGFYSGEEDMEFCSFSSDTESAVKTWQATIGVREDGIMTLELLDQLFADAPQQTQNPTSSTSPEKTDVPKDKANGAVTKVKEVQQTVVKKGPTNMDISENRVFLLGENRWEEPSRLNKGNDKLEGRVNPQSCTPNCLVCRGEGRLLCMECDGTGEPQVEEQFLDWVDGGTKCPYCEGRGYSVCDTCEGKGAA
ncbi:hypothetical protein SOVF_139210 [Spinacia oleracea]|uniref:Protein disulfide isomerase pTAC5, chloroplastic n=1 Tax=Spinacia oleracea TaxID=3562 RepID=A0A9R0IIH8_SPIOL|nr:protein disulfide isomerase pTAC5, chloroplastic [Spinacia oleracea]XP_021849952.1 protein disulfide isomerase pTAC5, chloroplastic [Spinacia oleracea]XP_021849953.1 protein disulfide isomerase pTAC5, chloroplastic [Spinacia oleracea]XP_056683161.1 protein disulfide isomerase pTAC5, chloroplastic [Spinacia oleracea]KNA11002.1 hypothetical protein SOVF_139210 [Spinacia oleracea]